MEFRLAYNIDENSMFPAIRQIHPLMQKPVSELIDYCRELRTVDKIIVFGSSIRRDCNSYSDLDIYVEGSDIRKVYNFESSENIDIDVLCPAIVSKGSSLERDILEGIVVYAKEVD